ncbi:MAG: leucine-rich repeat protein, partial [Clostridia bacterium]|nr:leucine-rich repeat protein [Clostridia bacterium]
TTGTLAFGITIIDNDRYYFYETDGKLCKKGWVSVNGNAYYADTTTGKLAVGMKKIGSNTYYFNEEGIQQKGKVVTIGNDKYYFQDNGRLYKGGWISIGGKPYYADTTTGKLAIGMKKIGSNTYYFNEEGIQQKGKVITIGNDKYYFQDNGRLYKDGWIEIGGNSYYADKTTGTLAWGIKTIGNDSYYFDENCELYKSGWFIFNNDQYYSNTTTGTLATGLNTVNGKKYYFSDLGSMQTGDITLDDQTYYFNELGYMELRDNYSYMQEDYCYNIENGNARIVWYEGTASNIIVPSSIGDYPVIRIGNNAFFRSRNIIQNVVLEDGIRIIEENAFYACDKLKSITFPDSITRISENAFGRCSSLEEVNMTNKAAVNIRDGAFEDCTSLKQIELSNRATVLSSVFARCTSLETVKLPAVYGEIPYKFFSGCTNLKNVEIPIYVKKIGDYAFENCTGLTALTIPKEVTTIGENAFSGCTNITLYVEKNSPAYTFAIDNNINYIVVGEEVSNETYRYYYYQLDDKAKILYDEIVDHLDAIKSGVDSIILSNRVNEYAQEHGINSFFDGTMQNAVNAFNLDYADVFYWDCTKTSISYYGSTFYFKAHNGASNFLEDEFNSAAKVEIAYNKVDTKINQIMNGISSDSTDYEIVAIVHDWLVDNLDYDYTFSTNCHNVYGTLVESKPVCEGYARTFKTLMDKYDIPCIIVTGTGINSASSGAHAWNYVQLDGEWYAMDVTWDDPRINGEGAPSQEWLNQIHHTYFLRGANNANFISSHILDDDFEVPTLNGSDYAGAA